MYQSQLLDAYKKAQNYIQDKQIAHDLRIQPSRITEMRKGQRKISDKEALILAEGANIDPEIALLGCHADQNDDPRIKQLWEGIAKKYNGLGITINTVAYMGLFGVLANVLEPSSKCVICVLC